MLLEEESRDLTPAVESSTSRKMRELLRKRIRQLLRVAAALAACLALGALALAIWWLTSLNGLPDIGDPFDVAAFRALRIPDDQNAFMLLRRATEHVTRWPELSRAVDRSAPTVAWADADPKLRAWVEANHLALKLFQRAAEKPDALPNLAGDPANYYGSVNAYELNVLALLEGARRQESGDTAGAWDCYRALLRMTAHTSRRRSEPQHHVNQACRWLRLRLTTWAADPRTSITQLNGALLEVRKSEPTPEWDSFALKTVYLELMQLLEQRLDPMELQEIEGEWTLRLADMQLSAEIVATVETARRFLLREPDRSRRVVKLLCANWLAHAENREPQSQKPAVSAMLTARKPMKLALFPVGRDAPAGARAVPPRKIASWLVTTRDARQRLLWANRQGTPWLPNHAYRRAHRDLVIMLATEIYRRERGTLPASEQDLIGTYLTSLPDDGSAVLADEMTPIVK